MKAKIVAGGLIPLMSITLAAQPNILLIMADDADVEAFQAYATNPVNTIDGGAIATPNIDLLADEGVRFTNAFTTPLCTPTRVMLLTGQYNLRNYRSFGYLDNDQTTFAQVLRANGYATAIAGKWQLSKPDLPITPSGAIAPNITPAVLRDDYGFDSYLLWQLNHTNANSGSRYWQPKLETASGDGLSSVLVSTASTDYGPDLFTEYLKDFITGAAAASQPFLAYYAMALPHDPWVSTPDAPGATSGDNAVYFDENIEYIDKLVGELVAHLEDPDGNPVTNDSVRENTLIIFTSDNGTSPRITVHTDERGNVVGDKGIASYDGTHVPFILNWQGTLAAGTSARMVDLSDVFPTLLEVAGISPDPAWMLDGQPVIDASGTVLANKPAAYLWYDPKGRNFPSAEFAQNQSYKLYADGRLYNIDTDKLETTDLNDGSLTAPEQAAHDKLSAVIAGYHETPTVPTVLAPTDASINGNLRAWYKNPASTYAAGVWSDSSGRGHHLKDITGISGYGGSSAVVTLNPAAGPFSGSSVEALQLDDNDLMGASGLNGGNGFSDLTILAIYKVSATGSGTRPLGIGSKTVEGTAQNYDRLNLATDGSIRWDDGQNPGTLVHPTSLVIRATRLSSGATVSDWLDIGGGLVPNIDEAAIGSGSNGTSAPSFVTKNDNLYLGEISANVGVDNPSTATYHCAQLIIYDKALTDAEIEAIVAWMRAAPEGILSASDSWRLQWFGQTEETGLAADGADPDLDGLANLLERAFGTDPTSAGSVLFPAESVVEVEGSRYLAVTYLQARNGLGQAGIDYVADGLTYRVETNVNLSSTWNTGPGFVVAVSAAVPVTNSHEEVTIRSLLPISSSAPQFMRVSVEP